MDLQVLKEKKGIQVFLVDMGSWDLRVLMDQVDIRVRREGKVLKDLREWKENLENKDILENLGSKENRAHKELEVQWGKRGRRAEEEYLENLAQEDCQDLPAPKDGLGDREHLVTLGIQDLLV